ncbi:MAG: ABC transporter substrate-binding protein [Myxococcales bacterium]|nr:ABC transporter substrate-binding protein [Myxococcales bacterium]
MRRREAMQQAGGQRPAEPGRGAATRLTRRGWLGLCAAALVAPSAACGRPGGTPGVLRVGHLPNLGHGPVLAALASGRLEAALGATAVEPLAFRAGPRIAEALLGRAIDVAVVGPAPLLATHARHAGALVLCAGVCSGGASLVVAPDVHEPADLAGRRVATPQLGSTQDVSLRVWLDQHGLATRERGGDVAVDALAAPDIYGQMQRARLAGAWLPEPWASRVVVELGARRLVDERDLWPGRRFPTALFVARRAFAELRGAEVAACARALAEEGAWLSGTEPERTRTLVADRIARLAGRQLPPAVMQEAWSRVAFDTDPNRDALAHIARDAAALGYLPHADASGL